MSYRVEPKVTHFHTLGIVPGSTTADAAHAYKTKVEGLLAGEFAVRGSMATGKILSEIAQLTEAARVLTHGDHRSQYIKSLRKDMLFCSLCEGKGKLVLDYGLTTLPCVACHETGWGTEYLQDYDQPRR